MSFEEAAAVCDGAILALTCLRLAGCSGAEHRRLRRVGLDRHRRRPAGEALRRPRHRRLRPGESRARASLGADEVVDYTHEDFTRNGETYDVVFDASASTRSGAAGAHSKRGGVYVETDLGFMWHAPLLVLLTRWFGDKRVTMPIPKYTQENVVFLKELIEAGEFRAVIDRTYPLEDVVEATRYVETGQKTGNVVLTVGSGSEQLGDQRGRARRAVRLDRPVVDLAADLLGDRRGDLVGAVGRRSPCGARRRSARAGGGRGSSARSGGGAGSRGTGRRFAVSSIDVVSPPWTTARSQAARWR